MEELEYRNLKENRIPGANMSIGLDTNAFPYRFVITNVRLDWNVFDIDSWRLKKAREINGCYLFCYRSEFKEKVDLIKADESIEQCLRVFSKTANTATDMGATIACYYEVGTVSLKLPNREWWRHSDLAEDLEGLRRWVRDFF